MDFKDIIYAKQEGIATITLNRPDALNALTQLMLEEWQQAIEDAKRDDGVRVLVLTGAGRAFCAGADVKAVAGGRLGMGGGQTMGDKRHLSRDSVHLIARALMGFDKPYIGAVNGAAAGGGMGMLNMCDIRIASDKAKFTASYVKMGLVSADGDCYFLPRIVGIARACELLWTGRVFGAQDALAMGYVSQVVPHDELMPATLALSRELAEGPPVAIQLIKGLIYSCQNADLDRALQAHDVAQYIASNTEDAKEGPRAWVEKRAPQFKGK